MSKKISICIPVFNYNITTLVSSLVVMCKHSLDDFEILVYDDGSLAHFKEKNRTVSNPYTIIYKELKENIGRSKIRNLLAKDAQFDHLLFLDCDVLPANEDFIANYANEISSTENVAIGGRTHQEKPDSHHYFRWLYGTKREETSAESRRKNPYQSFMTNNFLISKSIFKTIKFNEELKGYGHEDTFFGYELKINNIPITHINNPAVHIGLEEVKHFIVKTEEGLQNLAKIYIEHKSNNKLIQDIKILNFINNNKAITPLFYRKWKMLKAFYLKNILGDKPSLRFFDFYKLGFLINEIKKLEKKG